MYRLLFLFIPFILNSASLSPAELSQLSKEKALQGCYFRDSNRSYGLENISLSSPTFVDSSSFGGTCTDNVFSDTAYYDSELDLVVLNTSCQDNYPSSGVNTLSKYHVQFTCDAECTLPSGYDRVSPDLVSQGACSASYISQFYNGGTPADDAIWVDCTNPPACFVKFSTTEQNTTAPVDSNGSLGNTGTTNGSDSNNDYADILNSINTNLTDIKNIMHEEISNDELQNSMDDTQQLASDTVNSITEKLNTIIGSYTSNTLPTFTGEGNHIFKTVVYGKDIIFDLSMFEKLRAPLDIFWIFLLALITMKFYIIILRDLFKKI